MTKMSLSLISKLRKIADPDQVNKAEINHTNGKYPQKKEQERCDFCGKPIPPDHRHFADLGNMKFLCACEMCTVLQAEKGEYHPLPQRYTFLADFNMPEELWQQLKIPVNMAFFVYNSDQEQPIAFYPGPAGATESQLTLDAWQHLQQGNTVLRDIAPDLEGFLINRLDEPHEYYIVPIDCCYELIGLIRMSWEGLHGGDRMRKNIRHFFQQLKHKSH